MEFEGRSRIHSHLDMAPLIDVVFLLLVFFMLTSTFLVPEAIELELPASKTASNSEQTPIVISSDAAGQLRLNGEAVSLTALAEALKPLLEQDPEQAITLRSDRQTPLSRLLQIMDEIRTAGGRNIALATTPEARQP